MPSGGRGSAAGGGHDGRRAACGSGGIGGRPMAASVRLVAVEQPVDVAQVAAAGVDVVATRRRQAFRATRGMPRGVPLIPKKLTNATSVVEDTTHAVLYALDPRRREMKLGQW